jgi:hypothetical protein
MTLRGHRDAIENQRRGTENGRRTHRGRRKQTSRVQAPHRNGSVSLLVGRIDLFESFRSDITQLASLDM